MRRQRRGVPVVGGVQAEPARQPDHPTEVLAAAVAEAGVPVLVNSSAVGFYGDTRDRVVDEDSAPGAGFLARLCLDWEAATVVAEAAGTRVVHTRSGLVLSPPAACWSRLRPLFSLGLGARLGSGRQYMPWISLDDEVRALLFAIDHDQLSGPVNLTGPAPVTNAEFTAALGRAGPPGASGRARLRDPGRARRVRTGGSAGGTTSHPGGAGAGRFPIPPPDHREALSYAVRRGEPA